METIKGLTEELVSRDNGRSFGVSQLRCRNCGLKDDYTDNETTCRRCGYLLDKSNRTAQDINPYETKKIIDNTLVYKCPVCKKTYDVPTHCCETKENMISQEEIDNAKFKGRKLEGYYCTGCSKIYKKPIVCCKGSMMFKGDYYPDATIEEFKKVRNGLSVPVTGMMQ